MKSITRFARIVKCNERIENKCEQFFFGLRNTENFVQNLRKKNKHAMLCDGIGYSVVVMQKLCVFEDQKVGFGMFGEIDFDKRQGLKKGNFPFVFG